MSSTLEQFHTFMGTVGLLGVPVGIFVGLMLIAGKKLFGFAPGLDISRLVVGTWFVLFALYVYVMMLLSWLLGTVSPNEWGAFFESGAIVTLVLLGGIRILWLLKR